MVLYSQTVMSHTHALIALNRLWAVMHPISYRNMHSRGIALFVCVSTWVSALAINMPFLMLDSAFYRQRPSTAHTCYTANDDQKSYSIALELVCFVVPEVLVWLALPVVLVARWRRRQKRQQSVAPSLGTGQSKRSRQANSTSIGPVDSSAKAVDSGVPVKPSKGAVIQRNSPNLFIIKSLNISG